MPLETVSTPTSSCRAAEDVFDHSSHYQYLIDAAWEAVEQAGKHSAADDAEDLPDESNLATQMVRGVCAG